MTSKKVLIFIDKISYSGASKIACWLCNGLAEGGMNITLASHQRLNTTRQLDNRVNYIQIDSGTGGRISRGLRSISNLRKTIKNSDYDVCVGFLPTECFYMRLATAFLNVPMIACERSDPYLEQSFMAKMGRFFFRFAEGAVFQTEGAKNYYPKRLQKKSAVIPNPVFESTTAYVAYSDRDDTIGYSGRLFIRQKRQDVLLEAFSNVCKRNSTVKLVIFGDGPDEEALKNLAVSLGVSDRVIFAGKVSDVPKHIARCKVFVFTSDYEGIPNSIIEALQTGVPVVSTDCSPGGAKLLIQDGVNGFVVERQNPKAIADRLLWILSNEAEAETLSQNAVFVKDRFIADDIIKQWCNYLCRFIGAK